MLRVERLRLVLVAGVANCLAPLDVTTLDPGDILVGAKDETTGQAIVAFVILRQNQIEAAGSDSDVSKILRDHVAKEIGPIAKPRTIIVVAELPKTRSGKIMRRLLRDVAEDRPIGDVTTLADTSVMQSISGKLAGGAND